MPTEQGITRSARLGCTDGFQDRIVSWRLSQSFADLDNNRVDGARTILVQSGPINSAPRKYWRDGSLRLAEGLIPTEVNPGSIFIYYECWWWLARI